MKRDLIDLLLKKESNTDKMKEVETEQRIKEKSVIFTRRVCQKDLTASKMTISISCGLEATTSSNLGFRKA